MTGPWNRPTPFYTCCVMFTAEAPREPWDREVLARELGASVVRTEVDGGTNSVSQCWRYPDGSLSWIKRGLDARLRRIRATRKM